MAYNYGVKEIPDWNLNQHFSEIMKEVLLTANRRAMLGDLKGWFDSLRLIYINIFGDDKVDIKGLEIADELFKKTSRKLMELPDSRFIQLNEYQKLLERQVKSNLNTIHAQLLSLLYAAGRIYPSSKKDVRYASLDI